METKLNIAKILKDKPQGTKLYSPLFGDVYFSDINNSTTYVLHHTCMASFYSDATFIKFEEAEPLLFPSKEMRDWSKFAWKKGDVLVNKTKTIFIIFEGFEDDNYKTFKGKHCLTKVGNEIEYTNKVSNILVSLFDKAKEDDAQTNIVTIGVKLGGKLNRETLEIEKTDFENGDIICVTDNIDSYNYILIYIGQGDKRIYRYVTMFEDNSLSLNKDTYLDKPKDYSMRLATEEEKQQLFDALAKKGKSWDAEKKQIVDLKPDYKFKPFDKVVVYCEILEEWSCDIFSHYDKNYEGKEVIVCLGGGAYFKALPFNKETAKLLGTTNNAK